MSTEAQTIQNYINDHRVSDTDLKRIPPIHLIAALKNARNEMSYSNLTCRHLEAVEEILFRYCEQNKLSFGDKIPEGLDLSQWTSKE